MDPNVLSIILGVAANGLTSLLRHLGHKSGELLVGKDFLEKWKLEETSLQPILQNAPHDTAENLQWQGPPTLEETYAFLHSPEVEAIVRQIYSMKLSGDKKRGGLEPIRKEFLASFTLYAGFEKDQLAESAQFLFDTLLEGCDLALTSATDRGILSAHEAKSTFRHRILLDELTTIKKNLALLTARRKPNIREILAFEEKYRQQVATRHGYITPPYFDAARKVPIDELYVYPNFVPLSNKKREKRERIKMRDFLSNIYRAVLLGNPGGGKSTLALKLCYDIATHYSERLFAGRKQVTPILVVLRDYGAEKKLRNCSILQFIESKANANYQAKPPPDAFEYLLLNGRAVVIFDGLDELLDTSYRQEISSDVENFCTYYPSVPVLVTSREVGYEQAPLDEKRFEIFRLDSFEEDQVAEYVTKWFNIDTELIPEQREQKVQTFLQESASVEDLRSNPLMLALMCNIYRGENYIPKNRPDVYDKCSMMLFERWDRSRGIHFALPFEAHISPAMKYLAHWIYADEELRGGVTEKRLIAKATEYLCQRRFEDPDESEKAAREFIEFCRGRAWVFTDTGTTKEGERLYQFTHQTFLEFFTAAHLIRTHPTPNTLMTILQPRIAKREWDVVAQLAFQLQNKNVEGAGDELLTALIDEAHGNESDEGWNLLSFAARCLEFIVPSPKATREITKACFERSILEGLKRIDKPRRSRRESVTSYPAELLRYLSNAAIENRMVIDDALDKLLVERINSDNEQEAFLALEIGLDGKQEKNILDPCSARIEELRPKYRWLCMKGLWIGQVHIADLIRWHGLKSIFSGCSFIMHPAEWIDPAEVLLYNVGELDPSEERTDSVKMDIFLKCLTEVGSILLSCPLPWIKKQQVSPTATSWLSGEGEDQSRSKSPSKPLSLDSNELFYLFVLYAVLLEWGKLGEGSEGDESSFFEKAVMKIKISSLPFYNFMRWIFVARFEQVATDVLQAEIDNCGFTTEQQIFLWRWVRREIDLVQ